MAVVILEPVEQVIRTFENATSCQVTLPARILIQQFFVAIATEETGFAQQVDDAARLRIAQESLARLDDYLHFVRGRLGDGEYSGEIGLLPLIQGADSFAAQRRCAWWPRHIP